MIPPPEEGSSIDFLVAVGDALKRLYGARSGFDNKMIKLCGDIERHYCTYKLSEAAKPARSVERVTDD